MAVKLSQLGHTSFVVPRHVVAHMEQRLGMVRGAEGWRNRAAAPFDAHPGLKFFVHHPLDAIDREATQQGGGPLVISTDQFMERSGLGACITPEAEADYKQELGRRAGDAAYWPVSRDFRAGVHFAAHEPLSTPQRFGDLVSAMERSQRNRRPTVSGLVNSEDPTLTRQEIVAEFAYGDLTDASEVSFIQPFTLSEFHQYIDRHERFHGSVSLKMAYEYDDHSFDGKARKIVQSLKAEKANKRRGDWSTAYGVYLEENIVDCASMMVHLRDGGDPSFIRAVADMRACSLTHMGDFDHDTANSLYALADRAEDKSFVASLKHLETHEITDLALRHAAEHVHSRETHYGMMKYAASGQSTLSPSKCVGLKERAELENDKWVYLALPTGEAKEAWFAASQRAEMAADRLDDSEQKFARAVSFHPEIVDMHEDDQEAYLIELEERALMSFIVTEHPHLDNPADRKMLLRHRQDRIQNLNIKTDDEKDYFDAQMAVLNVMQQEESLLLEFDELCREDASLRNPEGEAHFFRGKLREANACTKSGQRPIIAPHVIDGLMTRRLSVLEQETEQAPAQMRESLSR